MPAAHPARLDAIKNDLDRYFTGSPCKRGHLSNRYVSDNSCCACRERRDQLSRSQKGKLDPEERKRRDYEATKKWRLKNVERVSLKRRIWAQKNKDKVKKHAEHYRRSRREEAKIRSREWRASDPLRNKESKRRSAKKNYETIKAALHRRKARKRNAPGTHSGADLKEILRLQKNKCAICSTLFSKVKRPTLDHIKPLATGGSNSRTNLQFLCMPCNSSKGARDPMDHARILGRLL